MGQFLGLFNYIAVIIIMMIGFNIAISHKNLIKKLIGINIFQVSVFILYISMGFVDGGSAPIFTEGVDQYTSPLPHVLILTAIVVGISTTALGLALIIRIHKAFGSVEEDEIQKQMRNGE